MRSPPTPKRARLYRLGKEPLDLPAYPVADSTGVDIDALALLGPSVSNDRVIQFRGNRRYKGS